ncbi:AFT1 [Candida theae]|uniref:AFT1 n=1 Tax=Candida theae TaxID=1198502 RepID=A0AAD5BG65_9ASCO|nr:AFT1 [Candida theae]KAI5960897.1 AFT1 [Candida theae]
MSEKTSYRIPLDDLNLESKHFTSKDDIKPWLQESLQNKGIHVVIERSDATKIIFKCKNKEKKTKIIESKNKNTKIPIRRHTSCPFKIRANLSSRQKIWSISVIDDRHDHTVEVQGGETCIPKRQDQPELEAYSSQEEEHQPQQQQQQQQQQSSYPPPSLSSLSPGMNLSKSNMDKKLQMESRARSQDKNTSSGTDQTSSVSAFSNRSADEFKDSPPTSLNSTGEEGSTGVQEATSSENSASNSISLPKKRRAPLIKSTNKKRKSQDEQSTTRPLELPLPLLQQSSKSDFKPHTVSGKNQRRKSAQDPKQQRSPQQNKHSMSPRAPKKAGTERAQALHPIQAPHDGKYKLSPTSQIKAQALPIPKPQSQSQSLFAIQALQNEVRQKIRYYILDNRNITDNQKTAMLDSFVSQLLVEYKSAFSPQFLDSLRQNLYGRENPNGPSQVISSTPPERANFQQNGSISQHPLNKKAAMNNWLLSGLNDSSGSGIPGPSIPLSPMLNDNDGVYAAAAAAATATEVVDGSENLPNNSLDNISPTSSINGQTSNGLSYSNQGNGQFSQIQNQGPQLPPINSIQDRIPSNGDFNSNGNLNADTQTSANNLLNNFGTPGNSFAMGNSGSGLGNTFGLPNGSVNGINNGSNRNSGNYSNTSNSLSSSSLFGGGLAGNSSLGNGSLMPPLSTSASTLNPSHILRNGVSNSSNNISNNNNTAATNQSNGPMMNNHNPNSQTNGNSNMSSLTPLSFNVGKNSNPQSFMTPSTSAQFGAYANGNTNGQNNSNSNQYLFASPSNGVSNQNSGNGEKDQGIMLNNLSNYDPGW